MSNPLVPFRTPKSNVATMSWVALATVAMMGLALGTARAAAPAVELPDGLELVVAAAPPMVNYPTMGCVDDRGRLFIGDSTGLNLNRKGLEEQLPHRVLVLVDTNGDGIYDKTTVFADRMTFPQGACWLDGALYVASPPGIWKLRDTNGDGVADQREMIVGGFDFTGNAADVHGPFLHPTNGRLYWCNGSRGHKVVQKDGTLVHEGSASGIWSCNPDGSEIQWHSLGAMGNPVEVDFTPDGEIVGVANLHFLQPRGDTLVHWLYGGAYERADANRIRSKMLADLPRTLEHMPVMHNFGHVAVSGFTRYRSGALNPAWRDNLFVTFFNTQKMVRVALADAGATYKATEFEFLKIDDPGVHLTDVIEDADGSLLVLDTGCWLTSMGCPSSLRAKDVRGAVYRIRSKNRSAPADPYGREIPWAALRPAETAKLLIDQRWMVREKAARLTAQSATARALRNLQDTSEPHEQLRACENMAQAKRLEPAQRDALLKMLGEPLEPVLEHAALFAAIATNAFDFGHLRAATEPALIRRLSLVIEQTAKDPSIRDSLLEVARAQIDSPDTELARSAVSLVARHPRSIELCYKDLCSRLAQPEISRGTLSVIVEVTKAQLANPLAQKLITAMLQRASLPLRQTAWQIIARQPGSMASPDWMSPLAGSLARARSMGHAADLALLIDAAGKLHSNQFDDALQEIIKDAGCPQPLQLKALAALSRPGAPLGSDAFARLLAISKTSSSPTARLDAARLFTRVRLNKEQLRLLAPVLASAGPLELQELFNLKKSIDAETARMWAQSLAKSPVFGSVEESVIKSGFQSLPADVYESILGPAVRAAASASDAKKRRLETLTARAANGRATEGRKLFETSACLACHQVGNLGRAVGPDLSRIGRIRVSGDVLAKILFPNASVAQSYESYIIETGSGQSYTGMIKSDAADGIHLLDFGGQEKTIPHAQIVGKSALATSIMPAGLEQAYSEQQLLDLVAWLISLK